MLRITTLVFTLWVCAANAQWRFVSVYLGTYDKAHTAEEYAKADETMTALADEAYAAIKSCEHLKVRDPEVYELFLQPEIQMIFYSNKPELLEPLLGQDYKRYCAVTDYQNHTIYLAPNAIAKDCGPLMATLMHEMFHLVGLQHNDLRPKYLFQDFIYTTARRCYNEFLTRKAK